MHNIIKFIILFFIIYSNIYAEKLYIKKDNSTDTINTIKLNNISYISLKNLNKIIDIKTLWFSDRDKIIIKIHKHDNIVMNKNNNFIIFNGKVFNIIYPVLIDKKNQLQIPYKTFIKLLNYKYDILKDFKNNTFFRTLKDSIIDDIKIHQKSNGTIISFDIGKGILFDKSYFNKALNINFFSLKMNGKKVKTKLNQIKNIKKIRIFNFDESCQLTIQFKHNIEKPKITYKNGILNIILRSIKTKKHVTRKKGKKKKITLQKKPILKKKITLKKKNYKKKFILVIDAGHGGKDPGAIGYNGTYEKNIALSVAKKLRDKFKNSKEIKIILTRDTDKFIKLRNRAKIANENKANLFISLHCNSAGTNRKRRAKTKGFAVYFLSQAKTTEARTTAMIENEAIKYEDDTKNEIDNDLDFIVTDVIQTKFLEESQYLAKRINVHMIKNTKMNTYGTGIDQAGFYVLKWNFMPAVLVEMGFLTHSQQEKDLNNPKFQSKISKSIYEAVIEYKKRYFDGK